MALDLAVSQALMRLRALERAVHDDQSIWTIEVAWDRWHGHMSLSTPAHRDVQADRVVFTARIRPVSLAGVEAISLCCGNTLLLSRSATDLPPAGPFELEWTLGVEDAVRA